MTHRNWDRAQSRTSYRRAYDASQQALEVALRENRVKDECLSIALGALQHTDRLNIFEIRATVGEIKRRLAQLEPEGETNPCEGCGNEGSAALFRTNPASGNALCVACEGYKEETG